MLLVPVLGAGCCALRALMEMAPLASGWDPPAGIGAPSDVPAADRAGAQLGGRRAPDMPIACSMPMTLVRPRCDDIRAVQL